jgi:hypothetical protein
VERFPPNRESRKLKEIGKGSLLKQFEILRKLFLLFQRFYPGTEEILMIFSRAGTLKRYEKLGMFDIIRKKAEEDIGVRILIGMDKPFNRRELEWLEEYPRIELRFLYKTIQTSITTIVTDRELSLVVEEKEEKNDIDLGLANYSNSESTVLSCASIFENLWAQSTVRSLQTTR